MYQETKADDIGHYIASDPAGRMRIQAGDMTSIADLDIHNGSLVYLLPEEAIKGLLSSQPVGGASVVAY